MEHLELSMMIIEDFKVRLTRMKMVMAIDLLDLNLILIGLYVSVLGSVQVFEEFNRTESSII